MKLQKPLIIFVSGLFLLLDRVLKWYALHDWQTPHLLGKFFGWQPFMNPGVAFSLPVPSWLTLLLTIPVLILVLTLCFFQKKFQFVGLVLIFTGALSNLIDRLLYSYTVDYILVFTGVLNVADLLIVLGFVLYIFATRQGDISSSSKL